LGSPDVHILQDGESRPKRFLYFGSAVHSVFDGNRVLPFGDEFTDHG
jgi:hypothetical protein